MMTTKTVFQIALLASALVACGEDDEGMSPPTVSKEVGADGGTVTLSGGPTLTIPSGSLTQNVTIRITQVGPMPGAMTPRYEFAPDGLTFSTPATVSFPVAPAASHRVFWSKAAPAVGYDELTTTPGAADVSAQITHFSNGFVAPMGMLFPVGDNHSYVISSVLSPSSNTQAREYGLDLDADQAVDNQLGMVLATLASMGFELDPETKAAVDQGGILLLLDLMTTDFAAGQSAGIRTLIGTSPMPAPCSGASDTTCRRHLTGTASFEIDATSPNEAYLVGNTVGGTLTTTSPGKAVLGMAFDRTRPFTMKLIGARAKVTGASATGITSGVIAGAMTQAEVDTTFIPELTMSFQASVTRDCTMPSSPPTCGCVNGSTGDTVLGLFDTDQNCMVSTTEVKGNSLIVSLFAPDVVIDGQSALSVGFGFMAVAADFDL